MIDLPRLSDSYLRSPVFQPYEQAPRTRATSSSKHLHRPPNNALTTPTPLPQHTPPSLSSAHQTPDAFLFPRLPNNVHDNPRIGALCSSPGSSPPRFPPPTPRALRHPLRRRTLSVSVRQRIPHRRDLVPMPHTHPHPTTPILTTTTHSGPIGFSLTCTEASEQLILMVKTCRLQIASGNDRSGG